MSRSGRLARRLGGHLWILRHSSPKPSRRRREVSASRSVSTGRISPSPPPCSLSTTWRCGRQTRKNLARLPKWARGLAGPFRICPIVGAFIGRAAMSAGCCGSLNSGAKCRWRHETALPVSSTMHPASIVCGFRCSMNGRPEGRSGFAPSAQDHEVVRVGYEASAEGFAQARTSSIPIRTGACRDLPSSGEMG